MGMTHHIRFCVRGTLGEILRCMVFTGMAAIMSLALASTAKAHFENPALEEIILSAQSSNIVFSQGMIAYQYQSRFYLPVAELGEAFEFYIERTLESGTISGWAVAEDKSFSIDTDRRELIVAGQRHPLREEDFIPPGLANSTDLYVSQEIINQIWPLTVAVNLSALTLDIMADDSLPFIQRKLRKERQKMTAAARGHTGDAAKAMIYRPNPWRAIGLPAIDLETQQSYDGNTKKFENLSSISGVFDFLFAKADFSSRLTYQDNQFNLPENLRLKLQRDSTPDQPLPLGLRRVEGGDIRLRHSPMIRNGTNGRGATATSSTHRREGDFDIVTIDGPAPPGWEVELYRNGELLEFSVVDARGEYRFEDVPLGFGNNAMRIVLYGPQGQIREETRNYLFGSNMLKPGTLSYTLGAIDADRDLIRLRDESPGFNVAQGMAISGEVAYGINRNATLYSTLSSVPTLEDNNATRDYLTAGASLSYPFGVAQIETYQDISRDNTIAHKGRAIDGRFITDLLGFKLNVRGAFFDDFESPESGYGPGAKKSEYEAGVQKTLQRSFGQLGLNLDVKDTQRINGIRTTNLGTRFSLSYAGLRLAHQTNTILDDLTHQFSTGQLSATARMRDLRTRINLNYGLYPDYDLTSMDAEWRYRITPKFSGAFLASHDFPTAISGTGVQLNYDFEKFIGSAETLWTEGDDLRFMLRASTSLGPYEENGAYGFSADRLGSMSAVQARVFADYNNDGIFNEGDQPIPGAKIKINNLRSGSETNDRGIITARQISDVETARIEIDQNTLFDPYFKPAIDGYETVLRPGTMPQFDFPVMQTGAIDGTLLRDNGAGVGGIPLELIDDKGDVIARTDTAYDGFYTFEYIRPGTYVIRTGSTSKHINVPPQTIVVASDALFASGIELNLVEQAAEADGGKNGEVAQPNHEIVPSLRTAQPAPSYSADPGDFTAHITDIRVVEKPDYIRLVLDLSGEGAYTLGHDDNNGHVLLVDMPGMRFDTPPIWQSSTGKIIAGYTITPTPDGKGSRLAITGMAPLVVGMNAIMQPTDSTGYRLYIDLKNKP